MRGRLDSDTRPQVRMAGEGSGGKVTARWLLFLFNTILNSHQVLSHYPTHKFWFIIIMSQCRNWLNIILV